MTKEDKVLVFNDLCARLPYHVRLKIWLKDGTIEEGFLDLEHNYADVLRDAFYYNKIKDIKPYLRPLSSMTEEEEKELISYGFIRYDEDFDNCDASFEYRTYIDKVNVVNCYKFLISRHFDINGLIPKGLAIEASYDMYK